jgi:mono/diheme cytochrome c family protein
MLHRRRVAIELIVVVWRASLSRPSGDLSYPAYRARASEPPAIEMSVATPLLRASVPAEDKARTNPLGGDPADIAAGQDIFRQKCEVCHGYDGSGKTEIGAGEYPRPPALRAMNIMALTDGEIFYHIRNGIRNTGMPDGQLWQLVAYLRRLPKVASLSPAPVAGAETNAVMVID